jgi:hypothetical protein
MDAIQVYALLNKKIKGLTSGIQSAVVNGTTITFTMNDGSVQEMIFPEPEDGISVTGMTIDENNRLICELSDGNSIDAGEIPTITIVETIVEETVQEQIETQLDTTIQEKVDKAVEEALGGGSGGSSGSDIEGEIDSWF